MRSCTLLFAVSLCLLSVVTYADISLIDASGLEYFINTDRDSTSDSASAAASDAAYTAPVTNVSTIDGGTTSANLADAFDGYAGMRINDVSYTSLGAPSTENGGRELRFPVQQVGDLDVTRKVFVPSNDEFARWLNIITNTSGATVAVKLELFSDLGSNGSTIIAETATGAKGATINDDWFVTAGDFGDPRLGHIVQGAEGMTQLSQLEHPFGTYDDGFRFQYDFNIPAGGTYIIMHFVTGQPNIDDAAEQAERLWMLGGRSLSGMSASERANVINFAVPLSGCGATLASSSTASGTRSGDLMFIVFATAALLVLRRKSAITA